jgi:hypothetical protein
VEAQSQQILEKYAVHNFSNLLFYSDDGVDNTICNALTVEAERFHV